MRIVEIKGSIAKDGSIVLPPGVLETMGVTIGDTVHLAYLSHHPVKQLNSYGEFFITKEGIDCVSEPVEAPETAELSVPHALLEATNIGLDDDLDITIGDGCIVLGSSNPPRRAWGDCGGNWFPPARRTVSEANPHFPQKMCAPMGGGGHD